MARESLLDRVPIPRRQVHRWLGEDPDPAREAARMDGLLRSLFPGGTPALDLLLLGMGPDGHVASLFPGSPALAEEGAWAAAGPPRGGHARLTLTLPAIRAARAVVLLASGPDKAWAAAEAWRGGGALPVQRVGPASGDLTLVLDAAAAAALRRLM
jgi:6-phosphogluconolactonase